MEAAGTGLNWRRERLRLHQDGGQVPGVTRDAPALWTFVRIEGIEPTNHAAESLRRVPLHRWDLEGGKLTARRKAQGRSGRMRSR